MTKPPADAPVLTQFDYLLNAFERASGSDNPFANNYGEKRRALFAYVRGLEAIAAAKPPEMTDLPHLSRANRSHAWHETRNGSVLVDEAEKIIGEVSKAIGDGYHAVVGGQHLGTYLTRAAAQRAVEARNDR